MASHETGEIAPAKVSARKLTVLYLLDTAGVAGPIRAIHGTTRLQKLLFLLEQRHQNLFGSAYWDKDFSYTPEKYGPADLQLYQDLEFLEAIGQITTGNGVSTSETPDVEALLKSAEESVELALPEEQEEEELSFEYLMGDTSVDLTERKDSGRIYRIAPRGRGFLERLEKQSDSATRSELAALRSACQKINSEFGDWNLKRLLHYVYDQYPAMTTQSIIRDEVLGP